MVITHNEPMSRRGFFDRLADGTCGAALLHLLGQDLAADSNPLAERASHFQPRAKAVIHLVMQGGPSQVDLFDPKPALERRRGQSLSREALATTDLEPATIGGLFPSPFRFARHGRCGTWVTELLPHLARQVDHLAVIRSMWTTHPNHERALYQLQSGRTQSGFPCLGSWVVYALGSENQNLPAYVVLADPVARLPTNGVQNWQAGFLPPVYQGTRIRSIGSPLLNLRPGADEPGEIVQMKRDLLSRLDGLHKQQRPGELWLDARIATYELAGRMQMQAQAALDLSREPRAVLERYGVGEPRTDNFARRCLMARRLVERGVRFVQLYTAGQIWDSHGNLASSLRAACEQTDKPVAALLGDLHQRGLLGSTLVLWGGEFGRLPIAELPPDKDLKKVGRGHGPQGFTAWMAGGGVKGGVVHGATDEIGLAAIENRVSVTDWHATVLHLLGLDHEKLFFNRNGFKERLTSTVRPRVVKEVLA
jgi:hypothetical protein